MESDCRYELPFYFSSFFLDVQPLHNDISESSSLPLARNKWRLKRLVHKFKNLFYLDCGRMKSEIQGCVTEVKKYKYISHQLLKLCLSPKIEWKIELHTLILKIYLYQFSTLNNLIALSLESVSVPDIRASKVPLSKKQVKDSSGKLIWRRSIETNFIRGCVLWYWLFICWITVSLMSTLVIDLGNKIQMM